MKVKLTDKALEMDSHTFALNYGINFKQVTNIGVDRSLEITDDIVIKGLKADGMIEDIKPSTKKRIGVRKCTLEEFNKNKLRVEDIDLKNLMKSFKPFITKTPQEKLK